MKNRLPLQPVCIFWIQDSGELLRYELVHWRHKSVRTLTDPLPLSYFY